MIQMRTGREIQHPPTHTYKHADLLRCVCVSFIFLSLHSFFDPQNTHWLWADQVRAERFQFTDQQRNDDVIAVLSCAFTWCHRVSQGVMQCHVNQEGKRDKRKWCQNQQLHMNEPCLYERKWLWGQYQTGRQEVGRFHSAAMPTAEGHCHWSPASRN